MKKTMTSKVLMGVLAITVAFGATACDRQFGHSTDPATAPATVAPTTTTPTDTQPSNPEGSATTPDFTLAPVPKQPSETPKTIQAQAPAGGKAQDILNSLSVSDTAAGADYERTAFGPSWKDVDDNGCKTNDDIMARDMTRVRKNGICRVVFGNLNDPYTGTTIEFDRVNKRSQVDIDHVVALGNAWDSGAWQWDESKRESIANDPLNLIAVDAGSNRAKGDDDASEWLPADAGNASYNCTYVARQVSVKSKYDLTVTTAEKRAMTDVLDTCPGQGVITEQ